MLVYFGMIDRTRLCRKRIREVAEGSLERGLGLGVLDATVKLDWPLIACMTLLQ